MNERNKRGPVFKALGDGPRKSLDDARAGHMDEKFDFLGSQAAPRMLMAESDMTDPSSALIPANPLEIEPVPYRGVDDHYDMNRALLPFSVVDAGAKTSEGLMARLGSLVLFEKNVARYEDWLSPMARKFLRLAGLDYVLLPLMLHSGDARTARFILAVCPEILTPSVSSERNLTLSFSPAALNAYMLALDRKVLVTILGRGIKQGSPQVADIAAHLAALHRLVNRYVDAVLREADNEGDDLAADDFSLCVQAHVAAVRKLGESRHETS